MEVKEHTPLAQYTTLRVGGPAHFFLEATSVEELEEAILFAKEKQLKIHILGGGSNTLFSDSGQIVEA